MYFNTHTHTRALTLTHIESISDVVPMIDVHEPSVDMSTFNIILIWVAFFTSKMGPMKFICTELNMFCLFFYTQVICISLNKIYIYGSLLT